jgi:hypothetical protein
VQRNGSGNESDGDAFQIDAEFLDGNIAAQIVLMNAAERSQEGAQARPQAFEGVGMDFPRIPSPSSSHAHSLRL